jgi:uncharacterized membrane protein
VAAPAPSRWSDEDIQRFVGRTLQFGVLLAAAVILIGAIAVLVQHGGARADYRTFQPGPESLRSVTSILRSSMALDSRAIVQLGLLLLIATPVARVMLTLVAFVLQRDRAYVIVTTIVLALLLYGLCFGR